MIRFLLALMLSAAACRAAEPFRLMSPEMDRAMRKYLPPVDDPELQKILDDPHLLLYSEREIPPAYQIWNARGGDAPLGLHDPRFNISLALGGDDPIGNGNREFPWRRPAGTDRVTNLRAFRFLWLPFDEETGRTWPVVWFQKRLAAGPDTPDIAEGIAWSFPWGTRVGEVLAMRGPDGKDYTFEVRVRTREIDAWGMDVFRPFPTAASLAEAVRAARPGWKSSPTLARLVAHLESDVGIAPARLSDETHPVRSFLGDAGQDALPPMDEALVAELLRGATFRSSVAETWREDWRGTPAFAPTTAARFHIVPANYDAGFVPVHRDSCIRCHETTNQTAALFDPGRDWWGRIRGSDGIFSFHPFDPPSISRDGRSLAPRIRPSLAAAGIVARYDPARHPASRYRALESLIPE